MPPHPTSPTGRPLGFPQRLRELGRLSPKTESKKADEFKIIHTPDRPERLVTPIEAPSEDECGNEIARWHRAAAAGLLEHQGSMYMTGSCEDSGTDTDESGYANESEVDECYGPYHDASHGTTIVEYTRAQKPCVLPVTPPGRQQTGGQLRAIPVQVQQGATDGRQKYPLPGTTTITPSTSSHFPTRGSVLGTPASDPRPLIKKGVPERERAGPGEEDQPQVNTAHLVRMEKYRRGYCPLCGKFFGSPLPPTCPYPDCRRDLRTYLDSLSRGYGQQQQAPPRLAERAYLDTQPQPRDAIHGHSYTGRPGILSRRPSVDNLRRTEKIPTRPAPPVSHSTTGSSHSKSPSRHGQARQKKPPLRSLSPPTIPPRSASISPPQRQLQQLVQHQDVSRPTTPAPGSPVLAPAPRSGDTAGGSSSRLSSSLRDEEPEPTTPDTGSRYRVGSNSPCKGDDDIDFLAWKKPEELAEFERELEENGDDGDVFLDIISDYST
ncbi:hypothetical protein N656DRAFT_843258 [Canariomyces notabilis]|uniref:Uncharacterized protein n=1 Tax=Canariomyces notabilis TaxID=2074819 RepID=A0AAN6THG7_9PEZI|nr:hypothetical protein N656DRAFT_843258 [Canariomyces arenarius]